MQEEDTIANIAVPETETDTVSQDAPNESETSSSKQIDAEDRILKRGDLARVNSR
jgi:hypothetical protein